MQKWSRLNYHPVLPLGEDGRRVTESLEHRMLSKRAAAEGAILLKNEAQTLPLAKGTTVAVFGKGVYDYVKGGGGSGDVTVSYVKSLAEGLKEMEEQGRIQVYEPLLSYYNEYVQKEYENGIVPGLVAEAAFPEELAQEAVEKAEVAIITISRFSGEDWDRTSEGAPLFTSDWTRGLLMRQAEVFEKGDFYLSKKEMEMVEKVKGLFKKIIVVLNVGGIIDVSWIADEPKIQGALQTLQGGMEGGAAVAELLCGVMNPCGRLSDTYARDLRDYPSTATFHDSLDAVEYQDDIYVGYRYFDTIPEAKEKVIYPFGYGLSYTTFSLKVISESYSLEKCEVKILVENAGIYKGKDVVELYALPPKGRIGKPRRTLVAFGKTNLLAPGEVEVLTLTFSGYNFALYDDEGIVKEAAWVLEKGTYAFEMTDSGINGEVLPTSFTLEDDQVIEVLQHKMNKSLLTKRLQADGSFKMTETIENKVEPVFERQDVETLEGIIPNERYRERSQVKDFREGTKKQSLGLVAEGKMTMDEFVSLLPTEVLIDMVGGQPNRGVANTYGFGNQMEYSIPNVMTADGPAGLRIAPECGVCTTAWPCATLLSSTWDKALLEEIGKAGGREVKENNIGLWLTPAVNIHRSPLCGRNFEYYSEDPFLAGTLASSMVKGIQSNGVGACVKHFACNNKETNRKESDSRVSERALREIYLKQFEIIIKTSQPFFVMSSYNIINGIRAAENKELLTDILRGEWKFEGAVCSDWWNHSEHYMELLAGEDLKMANGYPERVQEAFDKGAITRGDLEKNVRKILGVILKLD